MLYKNIRDLREDNDLTQNAIANILNIERSVYTKYENGKLGIPNQTLIELADFYNTSTDYLYRAHRYKNPIQKIKYPLSRKY